VGYPTRAVRRLHVLAGWAFLGGVPARLCAGPEPGRVHLGLLEAALIAQCLPEGLLGSGRHRAPDAQADAATSPADYSFLATSRIVFLMSLYYANLNNAGGQLAPVVNRL